MPQLPEQLPLIAGYRFEEQLGKGRMGAVYAARDLRLQRRVAIKLLATNKTFAPKATMHEARAMARVNHNHVVQIFDVIETRDYIALIMECLEGQTLTSLQRLQLLTLEQKVGVLLQIAKGLQAIHKAGLIHADIKPQNIWVTPDYQIKVLDFGIARAQLSDQHMSADVITQSESTTASLFSNVGSTHYASPEQIAGQPLEAKSDIYSFGVLSFELLACRLPFNRTQHTISDTTEDHVKMDNASHIFPPLPQALIDLLNTMLNSHIAERPKNINVVTAKLKQINKDLLQTTVLEDITLQFTEHSENNALLPNTTNQPIRRSTHYGIKIVGFSAILLVFIAVFMIWQPVNNQSDNRNHHFIVALEPVISLSSELSAVEQDIIVASVDDAIIQTLLTLEKFTVIDRQSSRQIMLKNDLDFTTIGKKFGVDELVSSKINCTTQRCQVSINRVKTEDGRILSRLQNYLPRRSALQLFQDTQNMMGRLFSQELTLSPNLNQVQTAIIPDNTQIYREFTSIYAQVRVHGKHNPEQLARLHKLIKHGYSSQQAHLLYRKLALNLFDDRKDVGIIHNFLDLIENASESYKKTVSYALDKFWISLYQGHYSEAKQAITLARLRKADHYDMMRVQAAFYLQQNEFHLAEQYFEQLLAMRINVDDLYNLALSQWHKGKKDDAEGNLQQLLELAPRHYSANQLLASVYLIQGNIHRAIKIYEKLTGEYAYSMDLSNLVLAHMLERNYPRTIELISRAIEQSVDNSSLHLNLADALVLSGNKSEGVKHYRRVLLLNSNSNSLQSLLEIAQAHAHLGNTTDAIHALNRATKLAPDNSEVAFISALVYQVIDEPIFAMAKIKEALAGGTANIWFSLPWFDSLCSVKGFEVLKAQLITSRCDRIAYQNAD